MGFAQKLRRTVIVPEFLAWTPPDERRYELVDGEIVAQAAPSRAHGVIQAALARHLGNRIEDRNRRDGGRCQVITEPAVRPLFDPAHNFRVCDLAVTCEPFDPDTPHLTAPVLIVEVLSPNNEREQRQKLHLYAALPSVLEILYVDTRSIRAELHRRGPDGRWPDGPTVIVGDEPLTLETAGLTLPLSDLYPHLGLAPGER